MLPPTKLTILEDFVKTSNHEELIFAKGFLEGYLAKSRELLVSETSFSEAKKEVKPLIVYATETGNSKKVAVQLLSQFKKEKIQAKTQDIFQFNVEKLTKETLVLFVVSTQGDGEFPLNAKPFYQELLAHKEDLHELSYAIFALGDTAYPLFCNAGILLDEALQNKNATRILPTLQTDLDFLPAANQWKLQLDNLFKNQHFSSETTKTPSPNLTKKSSYKGKLRHKIVLNDRGSQKETYHIEIEPSEEVAYQPGDALGIYPKNPEAEVLEIIKYFGWKSGENLTIKGETKSVYEWLKILNFRNLSAKSSEVLKEIFNIPESEISTDFKVWLKKYSLPKNTNVHILLENLRANAPRLYSISSAPDAHDGAIHLTVNLHSFFIDETAVQGLASGFLADFSTDEDLDFYIHPNAFFRLPQDDRDIILIGPGTGIAPFRSFLSQRDAEGSEGRNWLFFGEQHFVTDFYYQTEIQEWLATGLLTKLSTAFSRDQQHKIYVQDRIRENAEFFWNWIENGASIYICGQKFPMSHDVEKTIIEVIASQKNISIADAAVVLEELESEGRYLKDVY